MLKLNLNSHTNKICSNFDLKLIPFQALWVEHINFYTMKTQKRYIYAQYPTLSLLGIIALLLASTATGFAQNTNIAPLATITGNGTGAPGCQTGPCSTLNNLNLGSCGSQQMWINTSNPPSSAIGADFIEWNWPSSQRFDEMIIHHGNPNSRDLTGFIVQYWNGSAWVTHETFSNLPQQCSNTVVFNMPLQTDRMRITQFQMTGTGQTSNPNFREIEIIEAPPLAPDDAGVVGIAEPSGLTCAGEQNVVVTVQNFGTEILTDVTVNWEVGGNIQTPVTFNNLSVDTLNGSGPNTVNLFVGVYNFISINDANIKAWTTMPNTMPDTVNFNDTTTDVLDINFAVVQIVQSSDMTCADVANGEAIVASLGGVPPFTYYWSIGDTGAAINTLPEGTHTVILEDGIGCKDSAQVTIQAPDSMFVDLAKGGTTCKGPVNGFAELQITGGESPFRYNWNNGSKGRTINNVPPGSYSVTVTDDNGCKVIKAIDIIQVPILRSQLDSITPAYCTQNAGEASVTASGGLPPYSYNWTGGLSGRVQTGLSGGHYKVTVTDEAGCDNVTNVVVPEVDLKVTFDRPTFFSNVDNVSYQWYDCDNDILLSGETFKDFTPSQPGNYALIVTYETCTDTSGCHYLAYTSTEDYPTANLENTVVYPNPNNGEFTLQFNASKKQNVDVELIDVQGRIISTKKLGEITGLHSERFNTAVASGLYLLKVKTGEGQSLHRVIIR